MKKIVPLCLVISLLAGCSVLDRLRPDRTETAVMPEPVAPVASGNPMVLGQGTAASALDQTTAEEKAAALAAPVVSGEREIGKMTVALGSPTEQGFWLRSPAISTEGKGRVVTSGGQSVAVDLLPGSGGGAQLSLAAFRALGLGLTDLPEVTVYAN